MKKLRVEISWTVMDTWTLNRCGEIKANHQVRTYMHKHKREHIMQTFQAKHNSKMYLNTHHTHIQAKHNSTTYLNTHHDIIYEYHSFSEALAERAA